MFRGFSYKSCILKLLFLLIASCGVWEPLRSMDSKSCSDLIHTNEQYLELLQEEIARALEIIKIIALHDQTTAIGYRGMLWVKIHANVCIKTIDEQIRVINNLQEEILWRVSELTRLRRINKLATVIELTQEFQRHLLSTIPNYIRHVRYIIEKIRSKNQSAATECQAKLDQVLKPIACNYEQLVAEMLEETGLTHKQP